MSLYNRDSASIQQSSFDVFLTAQHTNPQGGRVTRDSSGKSPVPSLAPGLLQTHIVIQLHNAITDRFWCSVEPFHDRRPCMVKLRLYLERLSEHLFELLEPSVANQHAY